MLKTTTTFKKRLHIANDEARRASKLRVSPIENPDTSRERTQTLTIGLTRLKPWPWKTTSILFFTVDECSLKSLEGDFNTRCQYTKFLKIVNPTVTITMQYNFYVENNIKQLP